MSERKETLYHQVKAKLDKQAAQIVGERFTYPQDRGHWIDEDINLIVTPKSPGRLEFDPDQLNHFTQSLKILNQNAITMSSIWQRLRFKAGGETTALIFPAILYQERLQSPQDIIDPVSCIEYTGREGIVPFVNQFHSMRKVWLRIYPDWDYGNQLDVYRDNVSRGVRDDPTLESLAYRITAEQLEALKGSGGYQPSLRKLPDVPELQ